MKILEFDFLRASRAPRASRALRVLYAPTRPRASRAHAPYTRPRASRAQMKRRAHAPNTRLFMKITRPTRALEKITRLTRPRKNPIIMLRNCWVQIFFTYFPP